MRADEVHCMTARKGTVLVAGGGNATERQCLSHLQVHCPPENGTCSRSTGFGGQPVSFAALKCVTNASTDWMLERERQMVDI